MLKRFKEAHRAADAAREGEFMFDNNEFNTSYAKYLIEYLSSLHF